MLRQLTGNSSKAEDLTQDTFLAAYNALVNWRGEGEFGTWLCGIAYRRYANACRSHEVEMEMLDAHEELSAPDSDPLLHCTRREREQMIETAISLLPPVCREVFVLVKVERLAYRDAAQLLDIPVGTVQSRLWRAVRLLQVGLAEEFPRRALMQPVSIVRQTIGNAHPKEESTQPSEAQEGSKSHVM